MLTTFEELVRGEVYADLLAMAEGLRGDGYNRAAATLAGAALEEHLRKLAAKYAIATASAATPLPRVARSTGTNGQPGQPRHLTVCDRSQRAMLVLFSVNRPEPRRSV